MRVNVAGTGLVILLLAVSGCSNGDATPKPSGKAVGSSAPVIMPGGPGESARTATPGQTVQANGAEPNDADVRFMQMMIPHHEQALEMSALVKDRSENPQVRALAERIEAGQGAEIIAMQSWLRTNGKALTGGGHDQAGHGSMMKMPGMATPKQMEDLKAASGKDFDRLFLQLMITHHRGAMTMADEVLKSGKDVIVDRTALDVNLSQGAEIRRMQNML